MCVVEFSGLNSNFLVSKLQFNTVNFTVLFCELVYRFSVFFTKLFWQPQLLFFFLYKLHNFFTAYIPNIYMPVLFMTVVLGYVYIYIYTHAHINVCRRVRRTTQGQKVGGCWI